MSDYSDTRYTYHSGMSRRDSLKLLMVLAGSSLLPALTITESFAADVAAGHWPDLQLKPITAAGYGTDPNLILPPASPWPLTLTPEQLTLVACLSDILVPAEGSVPAASAVGVPAVVNEWISAPYPAQQRDRLTILSALVWLDDEATLRFGSTFLASSAAQQLAIIDDIAYDSPQTPAEFKRIALAFSRLRNLVLAAFFSTPEGSKDLGYLGNTAIAGDYPGPTPEAYAHLESALKNLELTKFAYNTIPY